MTSETTECNLSTSERLPLAGLLALATSGFITILTEALPAGLLPQMGSSLNVADAMVGQLVTLYAIGSLVAAIPLTSATQGWRRRRLLLLAIGGFAVVNTVTAVSTSYVLTPPPVFWQGYRPDCCGRCWRAMPAGWWHPPCRDGPSLLQWSGHRLPCHSAFLSVPFSGRLWGGVTLSVS
ncbi:putative sugar efflux transporter [Komagataeibacter europaeus]|nr:putative sugar efflux transporter [Komagataeibacter europaeus]